MSKEITNQQVVDQVVKRVVGQLKGYMDERFKSVGDHFTAVEERFTVVDEHFKVIDKRFAYMDAKMDMRFNEVLDATSEEFERLRTMIDSAMTKANTVKEDHSGTVHWLKRHDVEIEQLKIKTKAL